MIYMALHTCYFNPDHQICAGWGMWGFPVRLYKSRMSIIECKASLNGGLEDYNNNADGIFPHFSTPSVKNKLRVEQICRFFQIIMFF